jgi:transposase
LTKGGLLRIDAAKQRAEARLDGKFVIQSNDDSLTPADLAMGYKQLQRVEEAWRTLKSGLRLRPVFHWAVHRIHAHVALSVLALLLERVIEHACGDTWRNIRADLEQMKLAQLSSPHGEVWQVTGPSSDAANRLQRLGIKNPPPVLHLA